MVKSIDTGILVHYVMGLGQGNALAGEFSVNLELAFKIERGEIVGRVKDCMLAGNVYDALQDIAAVGNITLSNHFISHILFGTGHEPNAFAGPVVKQVVIDISSIHRHNRSRRKFKRFGHIHLMNFSIG